jgi:hypothetical protein
MRWVLTGALTVLVAVAIAPSVAADPSGDERSMDAVRRHFDPQADCAVFDTASFPAETATWDGPCAHGLADGHGTAVFLGHGGNDETISAEFRGGSMMDGAAEIRWPDGAHYIGDIVGGRPNGKGVLTNAKGDCFDGEWKDGALNGHGSVAWANGDRYEGGWLDGKAEGQGVQVWAGGQKYDGPWHNDLPNGQGTVTRPDGTRYAALFVNGRRQTPEGDAGTLAAVAAPQADATGKPQTVLDGLAGVTLIGIDGSTVAFAAKEGGLIRVVTAPDGTAQSSTFAFLGNGLGTVSDAGSPPQVSGLFRVTPNGVAVDYADGRGELLSRNEAGGLSILSRSTSGEIVCGAWYQQGHVFNADERKAAVAAYARRLGVASASTAPLDGCRGQTVLPTNNHPAAPAHGGHRRSPRTQRETAGLAAPPALPSAPVGDVATTGLQIVPVKPSSVHLIDADPAATATGDGSDAPVVDEQIASRCLKVDSNGGYWGFRNHCSYSVQFAYCLLRGQDAMTACGEHGAASVPGSVSANGFGALFADDSLAERGVEHDFRWVGCRGGAGEVAVHLDEAEPASGRCVRAGRTASRDN